MDEDAFELLTRKGVYPYEFMDSWEKIKERTLPSKDEYYSKLTGKNITEKDYEFAMNIYHTFKFKNLGEFHGK